MLKVSGIVVKRPRARSWRLEPAMRVGEVRLRAEEMAPPTKEPRPVAAARGRRDKPACRGEEPLTSWKRSGSRMVAVTRGKPVQKMELRGLVSSWKYQIKGAEGGHTRKQQP